MHRYMSDFCAHSDNIAQKSVFYAEDQIFCGAVHTLKCRGKGHSTYIWAKHVYVRIWLGME